MMTEREIVVSEAISWKNTPFIHQARVKGAGTDCLGLIYGVFNNAGYIPNIDIKPYAAEWALHKSEEKYLIGLMEYCTERDSDYIPLPADIVIFKFGRTYSHAVLVIDYPNVIHAYIGKSVCIDNLNNTPWLTHIGESVKTKGKPRPYKVFTLNRWI